MVARRNATTLQAVSKEGMNRKQKSGLTGRPRARKQQPPRGARTSYARFPGSPERHASGTPRSQKIKRSLLPQLAAQGPLDLAAGRFRQGSRPQQRDLVRHDLVLGDYRLANTPDNVA